MFFDRVAAKFSARESMRLNRPHPVWVTLVYYLLTSVLFAVVSRFAFHDLTQFYTAQVRVGYPPVQVFFYMLREYRAAMLLALAVWLV